MKGENSTCIIVGLGHAAAQLFSSLRREGWEGQIIMIGEEPMLPYHRPPLSKDYLLGKKEANDLVIKSQKAYDKANAKVILNSKVEKLDLMSRTITLYSGEIMPFDKLALTTGGTVRHIDLPGSELENVFYLRNLSDVEAIKKVLPDAKSAVLIGAGYIGLEGAAVLRKLGLKVTVIEAGARVLQRVTAPEVSAFFERVHLEEGVQILCNELPECFQGEESVERVVTKGGLSIEADLVIVGIGIEPNTLLAKEAGLKVDNGILVDEYAVTSDPDIVAAGDCTSHPSIRYGGHIRLESVGNAVDQAKTAAASLCGNKKAYDTLPWFWSEQYDMKLQMAGINKDYDQVILRGESETGRKLVAFYLRSGNLIAVDCVNSPREFMAARKLIERRIPVDIDELARSDFDLKNYLK